MSKYFSKEVLECHGDGCCDGGADNVNPRLLDLLDELVEAVGHTVDLNCVYRCPEHNEEVGGVADSQHVLGNAADIDRPEELSMEEFYEVVSSIPFDGIGVYYEDAGDFIHVDVRYGGVDAGIYWEEE